MKKIILTLLLFVAVIVLAGAGYVYQQYQQFVSATVFDQRPVKLQIDKGTNYLDFVNQVIKKGGSGEQYQWRILARLNPVGQQIKAGEYLINEAYSPLELIAHIANNQVMTYQITLVEGHNWKMLREQIENSDLSHALMDLDDAAVMEKLGIKAANMEGQLLPETYQYTRNDVDLDVLMRAHEALQQTLDEAWQGRDPNLTLKRPYELLILASIIEKETAQPDERNIISGVFHRRLQKDMKLQTDPTVIYGVGDAYAGDITRAHLRTDTPYNTYTRKGLPPTPIAMASAASIEAAAHPNTGNELYFVANNKGGHTFSETYAEHEKAVAAYLRGE